jgi:hypothetical protein
LCLIFYSFDSILRLKRRRSVRDFAAKVRCERREWRA